MFSTLITRLTNRECFVGWLVLVTSNGSAVHYHNKKGGKGMRKANVS